MKSTARGVIKAFLHLNAKLLAIVLGITLVGGGALFAYNSVFAVDTATIYFQSDSPALTAAAPDANMALRIDAQTEELGFVRVHYTFDNTKVQLTDEITVNPLFAQEISPQTTMAEANATGEIILAYGIGTGNTSNPPTGDFEFATFPITLVSAIPNDLVTFAVDTSDSQIINLVTPTPDELPLNPVDFNLDLNPTAPTATPTETPTSTPSPTETSTPTPTPTPVGANLSIEGTTPQYLGDNFTYNLMFSTDTDVSGVDADMTFDPSVLQIVSITPLSLLSDTSFSTYNNTTGTINFSQLEDPGIGYTGNGVLAQIEFEPLVATASSALAFDFTPGSTTDSNAVSFPGGVDILNAPTNFILEILQHTNLTVQLNLASTDDSTSAELSNADGSWTTAINTDSSGLSDAIALPDTWLGTTVDLYLKVDGYLVEKYTLDVTGGDQTADFGTLRAGDLNNDGIINVLDLGVMISVWNQSGVTADYNKDGEVNVFDYVLLSTNFNAVDDE